METYKIGSSGEKVKQIQKALGIKADGIFGIGTESEVRKFQKAHGLVADGIVGKKTLEVLMPNMDSDLSLILKPTSQLKIEEYHLPNKK